MKPLFYLPLLLALVLPISVQGKAPAPKRHNVILIVVNDIGPGDLGCYGNRMAVTPNIDRLFHESQRAENYHSYPISAPTWASALTGRIAEKTGVRRNYGGLQYPRKDDLLVSEMLLKAGFKTGFFGRWPFGDCYPYRAQDRGFAATLTTGAGGIGQPGDIWGNSSVNPTLRFNGKVVRLKGNMVDIIFETSPIWYFVFAISFIVLIVVHELVHGATWALFTGDGFKSIEFGFIKKYLTPYCTCKVALPKKAYILGALMPLILLGIIPLIISIVIGSFGLMWLGIIMVVSAAGDILIVNKILRYKTDASDILYFDHPTDAGGIIFEK